MSISTTAVKRGLAHTVAAAVAGAVAGPVAVLLVFGGPVQWAVLLGLAVLVGLLLRERRLIGWFLGSAVVSTIVLGGALFVWLIWAFSNWKG